jgi:hypothetical protein
MVGALPFSALDRALVNRLSKLIVRASRKSVAGALAPAYLSELPTSVNTVLTLVPTA